MGLGRVRSGQRVVLNDLCAGVGLGVLLPRIHRMLVSYTNASSEQFMYILRSRHHLAFSQITGTGTGAGTSKDAAVDDGVGAAIVDRVGAPAVADGGELGGGGADFALVRRGRHPAGPRAA